MLIRKVELENIKNYESGKFDFESGVTAISGPNGAGKTTILEAIAFTLFDYLPYRKEDFLKRGAKKGAVRVTFTSAQDGRDYTVFRDTGTGYYAFDPITKARLVEQKGPVVNWIREHLGVEPGTDLRSLFTSSIGVPQGTFTVDFAEQPARRKLSFDKVLRVDEYQMAADEMRGVLRHIDEEDARLKEEIARFVGELAALDGLQAERSRVQDEQKRLALGIADTEKKLAMLKLELTTLEDRSRRIEQLTLDESAHKIQVAAMKQQRQPLLQDVLKGELARQAVDRTRDGFKNYKEATDALVRLEPEIVRRDGLKQRLEIIERDRFRTEVSLQVLRDKQVQLIDDKNTIEGLRPLVERQEVLEKEKDILLQAIAELTVLKKRLAVDKQVLTALREEYSDLQKRLGEIDGLKERAERLPTIEQDRQVSLKELREAELAYERLLMKQKEAKRSAESLAKRAAEIKTLEGEMADVTSFTELIRSLPQLEVEAQTIMEQVTALRMNMEREERIAREVKDGMCPLLAQRCLNMKEGQGLDQFFNNQIGLDREHLSIAEQKQKEVQERLVLARKAERMSSALASQQTQLTRFRQDYEVEYRTLSRLQEEIKGKKISQLKLESIKEKFEKLERELSLAQTAREKYASSAVLNERLEVLVVEGREKREAIEDVEKQLSKFDELSELLRRAESELQSLKDPRGRCTALLLAVDREEEVQASLQFTEGELGKLVAVKEELSSELIIYVNLDEQIVGWREKRAANEKDHQIYLESQPLAAVLESKKTDLVNLDIKLKEATARFDQVVLELWLARSNYDETRHVEVRKCLNVLTHQLGFLAAELNNANRRLLELNHEIDRLLGIRREMEELEAERSKWQQIHSTSDLIRDLLKKSGPYITEAHLQAISLEANQIYRDVTGNPMVSLKWDNGYEVVLEEEGHERPFLNLSGGEQMTAALAIRMALLKELSEVRIAFFDEPTTNLDEERRRNLAQQIGRIKDFNQLFIVSHDDAFEGFTDRSIVLGEGGVRGG